VSGTAHRPDDADRLLMLTGALLEILRSAISSQEIQDLDTVLQRMALTMALKVFVVLEITNEDEIPLLVRMAHERAQTPADAMREALDRQRAATATALPGAGARQPRG
jgi:hypothetical protein